MRKPAERPPSNPVVQNFLKQPIYSTAQISPTGKYLAITVDRGDQDVLTVLRTSDLKPLNINVLPDKKSVGTFYWTSAERLLFNAAKKIGSFERPRGTGEWFAVNADGSIPRTLIEYGTLGTTQRGKEVGNEIFSLLDTLPGDDTNVLMTSTYMRSNSGSGTEVVIMDTISGRRKSLTRAPADNCSIALDSAKQPAFAVCSSSKDESNGYDSHTTVYRRGYDGKWTQISSSKSGDGRLRVLGSSAKGAIYAVKDDGKHPAAFGLLDAETGKFTELFRDPVSDISGFIGSVDDSEQIIAVTTEAGAPQVSLVDEEHPDTALYLSLANAFPGQFVNFSSSTSDGKKIVVSVRSDRNPGELYLYDRDTGKARFLMKSRPWIDPYKMGAMKSFSFKASDGRIIHAYLTIPKDSDGKNLPLIVNVHGGPMGPRDNWGYDNEAQMFASRGYATLQINYRGSGGFGKEFQDLAYGQWATGIMDDIIDGTRHVIEQGWADKERVCIYGGSFGGYASLMAPVRAPDMFKCAFGYVGLYDAQIQLTKSDTSQSESGKRYLYRAFGKTRAEQDAMSPINFVDKLKLPIYLAAGARDARCPPEHTEAMAKALEVAGNKPEGVIIQAGEEHGFYKEENNLNLYTQMLQFFDRHIGGQARVGPPTRVD
ncbi:MAG: S9 family peptidase [Thermomonas sp.]|uniref:S9 family peptidase n=1 Tax=Thermomonas sp. TaxID=1971895 RepID=UPI0039E54FA7